MYENRSENYDPEIQEEYLVVVVVVVVVVYLHDKFRIQS